MLLIQVQRFLYHLPCRWLGQQLLSNVLQLEINPTVLHKLTNRAASIKSDPGLASECSVWAQDCHRLGATGSASALEEFVPCAKTRFFVRQKKSSSCSSLPAEPRARFLIIIQSSLFVGWKVVAYCSLIYHERKTLLTIRQTNGHSRTDLFGRSARPGDLHGQDSMALPKYAGQSSSSQKNITDGLFIPLSCSRVHQFLHAS